MANEIKPSVEDQLADQFFIVSPAQEFEICFPFLRDSLFKQKDKNTGVFRQKNEKIIFLYGKTITNLALVS